MIDEEMTVRMFGYTSSVLAWKSHKKIVVMCDECCLHRIVEKRQYRDLCHKCALKDKGTRQKMVSSWNYNLHFTEETRQKMSKSAKGREFSDDHKRKIGKALKGISKSDVHCSRMSESRKGTKQPGISQALIKRSNDPEVRILLSCISQGITRDKFMGFVRDNPYYYKFNENRRELNRDKYGRRCFLCNLLEENNKYKSGKQVKLSVHHTDMNKQQGCDDIPWLLVSLCIHCHGKAHTEEWKARIEWLLKNVWDNKDYEY